MYTLPQIYAEICNQNMQNMQKYANFRNMQKYALPVLLMISMPGDDSESPSQLAIELELQVDSEGHGRTTVEDLIKLIMSLHDFPMLPVTPSRKIVLAAVPVVRPVGPC